MLKATKVAKLFMFPPLCSLVLEPDLDTGKKEKAQKWTGDGRGTAHIQLLSLLSEHQNPLTSSLAEPGAESKGKHGVQHSTFHILHSMWDLWTFMTASFLSQLTEELGSPCLRKNIVTGCSRSSRALLGKQILSWWKLCSSQGTWHSVFPRRCNLLHDRALLPCSQVNRLGKDPPSCFAGLHYKCHRWRCSNRVLPIFSW